MPAVPSSSVSERQERASLRSRALQNAPSLTSEDTGSGNLMSSANGQGRGGGRSKFKGRGGRKRRRGNGDGGRNNPISFDVQIDNEPESASLAQPDQSRSDTPVVGPIFAYGLQKVPMTGDLPFFNDNSAVAIDDANGRIYMYGGQRQGCLDWTSDFYVCSVADMSWQTWTFSMGFPFQKPKPLPCLCRAASTFLRMNGCEYVFLFGGRLDDDGSYPSSGLIAIDVKAKMWAYVNVSGNVHARIDATMAGVDNRLYIFGGRPSGNVQNYSVLRSYSVAECVNSCWTWIVEDEPYTADVPNLGFGGRALPVYDGMKILLTPGRVQVDGDITMSEQNVMFFHTENRTFQSVSKTNGKFPAGLQWYNSYAVKSSQRSSIPLPRAAGLPPREGLAVAQSHPSIVIMGWINSPDDEEYLVPEVWQYFIPPKERVQCFNLHRKLWALDLDLQTFITVNGRHFLFGVDGDNVTAYNRNSVYNVCVELDLQRLQPPEKKTPSLPLRNVKGKIMKQEIDGDGESEMIFW